MPIRGNTQKECFEIFREHVAKLVGAVLPTKVTVLAPVMREDLNKRVLSFGAPGPQSKTVGLKSRTHGTIFVYLSQNLETVPEDGAFRLRTEKYSYFLYDRSPTSTDEPMFRWEYVADPGSGKWCRHHFHVGRVVGPERQSIQLPLSDGHVDLNHLHIPTSFVLIEYVIRFLINDLGVIPKDELTWQDTLRSSENRFFREFSPKYATR